MDSEIKKFKITGMSCAACSARVERAVNGVEGVSACEVNLLLGTLSVNSDAPDNPIIDAVRAAGYGAAALNDAESDDAGADKRELRRTGVRLIISGALLLVLMYLSMGHTMLSLPLPAFITSNMIVAALLQMALSLAVMVMNAHFFISGTKAVLHLSPNMDTLVALGSLASFIYSTVITVSMIGVDPSLAMKIYHGLYFESAAMIPVLVGVGKMLEHMAKGKTTDAIRALMDLTPAVATVFRGGEWVEIPAAELSVGDVILVKRGENVVCDGIVEDGECTVSEASLTGESMPVDKRKGHNVYGGTTVLSGAIKVRATEVGEGTVISGIVRAVKDAASSKAPIAKLADRVAGIFVPFVMAIAIVSALIWLAVGEDVGYALARGVCVLVISCPCALGLATPVCIMVGSGVGAKMGILFKNATSLERLGEVKTIAFDKTGTVTEGKPHVENLIAYGGCRLELSKQILALEKNSEHPIASALCEHIRREVKTDDSLPTEEFEQSFGGISALIGEKRILGGNPEFLSSRGVDISAAVEDCERLLSLGHTVVLFAENGKLTGLCSLTDKLKRDVKETVSELNSMGIASVMISGDSAAAAGKIAAEAGISEFFAGVFPDEKAEKIAEIKLRGGGVAMVGDGVNDAPALTAADVGIAVGRGTDIAINSADVVLVRDSVAGVYDAVRLSKRVMRGIKQNLFWAFCYNIIGIPLAAGAFVPLFGWSLSPMFGAAAMSVSSLLVVSNALLIGRFRSCGAVCTINSEEIAAGGESDGAERPTDESTMINIKKTEEKENNETMKSRITIKIEGMMCPHCSGRVKKVVEAVEGVSFADVSHERGDAVIEHTGADIDAVRAAITDAGYTVVD